MPGDVAVGGRLCVVCGQGCVLGVRGEGRGCICVGERGEGGGGERAVCVRGGGSVCVCVGMWEHSYCKRFSHSFYFVLRVYSSLATIPPTKMTTIILKC